MKLKIVRILFLMFFAMLAAPLARAQWQAIEPTSDRWVKAGSSVVEHLGRQSLRGGAYLKDVEFTDGVIEVDVAMDGSRCFPGIVFRMQSATASEYFYLRPHRTGTPVALQYTPVFNGMDAWQLYHGPGFTAQTNIAHNRWVRVRLEVKGTQARAFLDDASAPALVMDDLKHGAAKGTIGLIAPASGQVHFSNFRFRTDEVPAFSSAPKTAVPEGIVRHWEISQAFDVREYNREAAPEKQKIPQITWRQVETEPSGLVNVSRWVAKSGLLPQCIVARTSIESDAARQEKLVFGYSDQVTVFLNARPIFTGNSTFLLRDAQFYGAVGLYDTVYLDLRPGKNELLLVVTENFGGWGFMAQRVPLAATTQVTASHVARAWETPADFRIPETVVYDPTRRVFFVSSFVGSPVPGRTPEGFISKVSPAGEVLALRWVEGLKAPGGLAVAGDTLFAVERDALTEIDIPSARILKRTPAPRAVLLNDVAVAPDGNVYVSDSGGNTIYRRGAEALEPWLTGYEVSQPNGLHAESERLIFLNNGDRCLKAVTFATKQVVSLARFGPGILDGLEADGHGNFLVSHWEGAVYRLTPAGTLETLVDTRAAGINAANFAFVPEDGLLVIPTFLDNRVVAYRTGATRQSPSK